MNNIQDYSILFIARAEDNRIPESQVRQLYDLYKKGKDLWIIPGASHLYDGGHTKEYRERILEFLKRDQSWN